MKKKFFSFIILAASLAAVSCNKETNNPNPKPEPDDPQVVDDKFEVSASIQQTKTAMSANVTSWTENDALLVSHNGISDGKFDLKDAEKGIFQGELAAELTQASNDWTAVYPYAADASLSEYPVTITKEQAQSGVNSMSHLCGSNAPLYAVAAAVAKDETPAFEMNHLASFLKVTVKNGQDFPYSVNQVEFWNWIGDGSQNAILTGAFTADLTAQAPVLAKVSGEPCVSLSVENAVIEAGASADFFMAVAPCTLPSGASFTVYVNGGPDHGGFQQAVTFSDLELKAGEIKAVEVEVSTNKVQIAGDAVGGWDLNKQPAMTPVAQGQYTWTGKIGKNSFRFVLNKDWEKQFIPADGDHELSYAEQELALNFSSEPGDHLYWNSIAGEYKVDIDVIAGTMKVTKVSFDKPINTVSEIYLTGDFNSWGVKGADSAEKTPAQFTKEGDVYTLTIELEGGIKNEEKGEYYNTNLLLYGDEITDNWTGVAGSAVYMSKDNAVVKKYIQGAGVDGFNGINVQDSGKYKITVDMAVQCVSIEAVAE